MEELKLYHPIYLIKKTTRFNDRDRLSTSTTPQHIAQSYDGAAEESMSSPISITAQIGDDHVRIEQVKRVPCVRTGTKLCRDDDGNEYLVVSVDGQRSRPNRSSAFRRRRHRFDSCVFHDSKRRSLSRVDSGWRLEIELQINVSA